jgi:hypothetical protein
MSMLLGSDLVVKTPPHPDRANDQNVLPLHSP